MLPEDIEVRFEFDQSPYVTQSIEEVGREGVLGAILTGLMVLLFLRDWRAVIVVVLNIPIALLAAVFGLWLTGQTINLMTLGGLALAVGILVDMSTVEVENIHTHLADAPSVARAALLSNGRDRRPPIARVTLRSGGFPAVVFHGRRRPGIVRPAVDGGRLRHGRGLSPVQHLCSRAVGLDASSRSPGEPRGGAVLILSLSVRLRQDPGSAHALAMGRGDRVPRRLRPRDRAGREASWVWKSFPR